MSRIVKSLTRVAAVALFGIALAPLPATGHDRHSPLVPPNANFRGKSFEEWNILYMKWFIKTNLGGQNPSNTVDGVRFLPYPAQGGTYEFDVRLRPGTPFVQTPFPLFGETYDNGTEDNPNDPFIDVIFEMTSVRVELDGRVLMDGTAAELCRYGFGPEDFNRPIVYEEPQPRGPDLNATSAIFGLGVGAVYRPLPPGRHTLQIDVVGLLGDFHLTYNIRVR